MTDFNAKVQAATKKLTDARRELAQLIVEHYAEQRAPSAEEQTPSARETATSTPNWTTGDPNEMVSAWYTVDLISLPRFAELLKAADDVPSSLYPNAPSEWLRRPLDLDFGHNRPTSPDDAPSLDVPTLEFAISNLISVMRREISMRAFDKHGGVGWLFEECQELKEAMLGVDRTAQAEEAADVCAIALALIGKTSPTRSSDEIAAAVVAKWVRGGNPAKR